MEKTTIDCSFYFFRRAKSIRIIDLKFQVFSVVAMKNNKKAREMLYP